ncbi:hypothetical protein HDU96_008192, partial [Phlyctochytrium bullatum]
TVLLVSAALYFILNGLMFLYAVRIEKEVIFVGYRKDKLGVAKMFQEGDRHITVSSRNKRFTSVYSLNMEISVAGGGAGKKATTASLVKDVGFWFDVNGLFIAEDFYSDIRAMLSRDGFKFD